MKRVLITGTSGVGKSSVLRRLSDLGYRAVDVDEEGWLRRAPDGGWVWQEDRIEALLDHSDDDVLFVAGCAESQVRFYPRFDHVVLLSAPPGVIVQRLAERMNNPYGKSRRERGEVLDNLRTVEPLLREAADCEIDATLPLGKVVERLLEAVGLANRALNTETSSG